MLALQNKVAIITGGGTGIGRGTALALSKSGAEIVVCGRRVDRLKDTANAIQEIGNECSTIQADVTKESDVQRLVDATLNKFDRIDILINNAGIYAGTTLHELQISDWDLVMETNLRGPFLMVRHVLPTMRAQLSGHIINISSESGLNYYQNDSAYGTSKHALNAFGEYVQRENQEQNIRVNTICPGMVVTEMTENRPGLDHEKCLYPRDIADLVTWLLTRRPNIKIGTPILIQTMQNPWK